MISMALEVAVPLVGNVLVVHGDGRRADLQQGAFEKHQDEFVGVRGGDAGFHADFGID
jgi:hypothetical protein